ncbi:hypothetical protein A0H81_06253 [Grifola frondosa]|uniref:Yeast cell wall synthesis Kre9/Knh1-like N-terminal domain-containing protein n=1 Tax=Grifola frondosa TaxID=5627 RepID=A0A1C7MBB0_GRIFR|nr:hypothetical protein A0H81_06253 [Grifola frondosa]
MFIRSTLTALVAAIALVKADPDPTAPGPGDVFKVGGDCLITWDPDTSGTWKTMNIELMTGDNFDMVHITTVTTVDGTDSTKASYTYTCPSVTPNSAIYFYQFTSPASSSRYWTTRFAIADASGATTNPTNSTQPDGSAIPWGTGALTDPSQAVAAPSYLAGGTTAVAGTTSYVIQASAAASGGSTTQSVSLASGLTTSPLPTTTSSASTAKSSTNSTSSAAAKNSTSTNDTSSASANANAALGGLAVDGYLVHAAAALGVAAFTFAVAL